jgi:FixJ family two-component response regulator
MPGVDGLKLLRLLASRKITLPVIIVAVSADVSSVVEAFSLGVFDFLERPWDKGELLRSVKRAVAWDGANRRMQWQLTEIERRRTSLETEEVQILDMLCAGKDEEGIPAALHIDVETFQKRLARVFEKLQVGSLVELASLELIRERLRDHARQGRRLVRLDPSHLDVTRARGCPEWLKRGPHGAGPGGPS